MTDNVNISTSFKFPMSQSWSINQLLFTAGNRRHKSGLSRHVVAIRFWSCKLKIYFFLYNVVKIYLHYVVVREAFKKYFENSNCVREQKTFNVWFVQKKLLRHWVSWKVGKYQKIVHEGFPVPFQETFPLPNTFPL